MRFCAAIFWSFLFSLTSCIGIANAGDSDVPANASNSDSIKFVAHRIGNYRSEACCVGDFNNDGKLDIVAGPYLYLAPDFKPQKIREIFSDVNNDGKGYCHDFMNIAMDVDGDGWLDIVACSWFEKRATWYRNPGKAGGPWKEYLVEQNGNFETGNAWDLFGTGKRDVILPDVARTVWYDLVTGQDGKRQFVTRIVSEKPMEFGSGIGDINGDGRPDIIRPNAWFEAPANIRTGNWIEHPLALGGKKRRR